MPPCADNRRKCFITWFKAIACLLILNSHCRSIYPFYFMAVGGGHGNGLFFVLSGYCLAEIRTPFLPWYGKRIRRILPMTLLVAALGLLVDGLTTGLPNTVGLILLLCLNRYWFVWAILIYYVGFYFIFRRGQKGAAVLVLLLHGVGYLLLYLLVVERHTFSIELEGFSPFKVYFYFSVFLCGGLIRLCSEVIEHWSSNRKVLCTAIIAFSCLVWCGEYAVMMVAHSAYGLQFLIHLSVLVFSVAMVALGLGLEVRFPRPKGIFGNIVTVLSDSTLEIYLVQVTIQHYAEQLPFPINWGIFWGVSILMGMGLHRGSTWLANFKPVKRSGS